MTAATMADVLALQMALRRTEEKRALAQGKADNFLMQLQKLQNARCRGRRANRLLREKIESYLPLIEDLIAHEGAEGFSDSTHETIKKLFPPRPGHNSMLGKKHDMGVGGVKTFSETLEDTYIAQA